MSRQYRNRVAGYVVIALLLMTSVSYGIDKPENRQERRTIKTMGNINALKVMLPKFRHSDQILSSPFGVHRGVTKVVLRDITKAGFKWIEDYINPRNMPKGMDSEERLKRWEKPNPEIIKFLQQAHRAKLNILIRLSNMNAGQWWPTWAALQVSHYKQWVKDWQLGNELNIGGATPRMQPEDYALLANETIKAIKAEDPEARVWVGATAMLQCLTDFPYPWIPRVLKAGLEGDGFAFHAYHQPYVRQNFPERGSQFRPWNYWKDYAHQIADLRSKLDNSKLTKGSDGHVPIADTEVGWPTNVSKQTWKRQISLLTQAKYQQRDMLLDFWLGIRPQITFVESRRFNDLYNPEANFQLVQFYSNNVFEHDDLYRPAYFAAAAVCSNIDDTLEKTSQRVEISVLNTDTPELILKKLNPQIMTFERKHKALGFTEVVIVVWAGVPAEDDFQAIPVSITLPGPTKSIASIPIGYSLLPVGVTYSKMDQFDWGVKRLSYELSDNALTVKSIPLSDAPYVIKFARRLATQAHGE